MDSSMYPDNIIGLMFKILDAAMSLANGLVENLMKTPSEILGDKLAGGNVPNWLRTVIEYVLEWSSPLLAIIDNYSLFDILIGSALLIVLVIGVVKYFGDTIGL